MERIECIVGGSRSRRLVTTCGGLMLAGDGEREEGQAPGTKDGLDTEDLEDIGGAAGMTAGLGSSRGAKRVGGN